MDNKLLIALITSLIDESINDNLDRFSGDRGPRGLRGKDGRDFDFEESREKIVSEIHSYIDNISDKLKLKFSDLSEDDLSRITGPKGSKGRDGKDFDFEENKESIKKIIKECSDDLKLRFSDLSKEEISLLIGPKGDRGPRGQKGKSGKDFDFEESKEDISKLIESKRDLFKLKFSDLTEDEIDKITGPRGLRGKQGEKGESGKDGKDFNFESSKEAITLILESLIDSRSKDFKLKFSDLTEDEKSELIGDRGPRGLRGQKGNPGKDFDFDEHEEKIKDQVQSFINSIRSGLKLTFQDLTEEEIDSLSLKFEDLNEDQKASLKGDRGMRGPRGQRGQKGESIIGPRGMRGPRGEMGLRGLAGQDGINGKDAPIVTRVEIEETSQDYIRFVFYYNNGTVHRTNSIELPSTEKVFHNYYSSLGGGGGGSTASEINVLDDGIDLGVVENLDFGENLNVTYDEENKLAEIQSVTKVFDEGGLISDTVKSFNFIGDSVVVESSTKMSDWLSLNDVTSLSDYEASDKATVDVIIGSPSKFSLTRIAAEPISRLDLVTLVDETTVEKAGIDNYLDAVVAGVALNSANAGQQVEFVTFGIIEDSSFSFSPKLPLFLSSTSLITDTPHNTSGKFLTKIGRSYGNGAIFIELNDPRGIA